MSAKSKIVKKVAKEAKDGLSNVIDTSNAAAMSRLANPTKSYQRDTLSTVLEDYAAPILSTVAKAGGNILGAQYGLLGNVLQNMASAQSPRAKEQHGSTVFDVAAGAYKPIGDVKSLVASTIGNATGSLIDEIADRARTNSLYNKELQRQQDINSVYGSSNISSGQWQAIGNQQVTVKDLLNKQMRDQNTTVSDERVKDIICRRGALTPEDAKYLASIIGDMDDKHNFENDGDTWTEEVLDKYAQFIHNYLYTYTESARDIDPNIDTNQEHIGPMAQDIEKVNPACIKETADGIKTVDTGRLALMNAGAIADLARDVKAIKETIND